MNLHCSIQKKYLLIGINILCCFGLFSQTGVQKIEIVHADVLKYNKTIDANRLIGNVICKHEQTFFYCDSAYLFPNQSLKAFGKIKIQKGDSLTITAETLNYDASTKIASLEKNVNCIDRQINLKTEVLQYNTQTNISYYPNGATIIRHQHTLSSKKGYYYSSEKKLVFKENVELKNSEYTVSSDTLNYFTENDIAFFDAPTIIKMDKDYIYCEKGWYDTKNKKAFFSKNPLLVSDYKKLYADSLFYDESKELGIAIRNVKLVDTAQKTVIYGNYAEYNRKSEKALITEFPVLVKSHEKKDTLYLKGDTLYYEKKDSAVIAKSVHNAAMYHKQFQAISDYIIYTQKDSVIQLFDKPKFWFGKSQATAKQSFLFLKNQSVDKIILDTNAMIVQEADTIIHNKYNQISGRKMVVTFFRDSIKTIDVNGNAQVYYFVSNNKKWTGLNKVKCSKIRVDFLKGELYKAVFLDHPDSQLTPMSKIQADTEKLSDFSWLPQLRPQLKDFIK